MSYDMQACDAEQALVEGKIGSADAKRLITEISALPPLPRVGPTIDIAERYLGLDGTMGMARASLKGRKHLIQSVECMAYQLPNAPLEDEPPAPGILDWDVMLREFNHYYDRIVAAENLATFAARRAAFAQMEQDGNQLRTDILKRGAGDPIKDLFKILDGKAEPDSALAAQYSKEFADFLTGLLASGHGKISDLIDRAVMRLELSKVSLALAAYRAEKGQFPDKLDALAPAYLKEIPKDLFTDGPLVYKKTPKGFLLYSLGPSMKDNGGKSMDEDPENFNIVVTVE
jgi:hypothetical protein